MITSDSHMHTRFSTDSDADIRDMIESALKKGLQSICITDHIDKDYPFHEDTGAEAFLVDLDEYFPKLAEWKEAYAEKIQIRRGIELGLQPHLAGFYEELTNQYPFDFVIGSVHVVHGMDPYYGEIFEGRSDEEVYKETFLATLENLDAVSSFDVLGHLDYVVRYGKCQARQYSYKKYAQECFDLVKALNVSDVEFTGRINVRDYLGKMDFTLLTSISEGQPLTILESFAAHKPVVATDVGNCRELLFGVNDGFGDSGILTHIMNIEEIAEAMVTLAWHKELREQMGEAGYKRVKQFYRIEQMKEVYRNIYKEFADQQQIEWTEKPFEIR